MTTSDLIKRLMLLRDENGDKEVYIKYPGYGYDNFEPWQVDYSPDYDRVLIG